MRSWSVLRAKGIVRLDELPDRYCVFQRTDDASRQAIVFPLTVEPVMSPCAVLIGVRLDVAAIRQEALVMFGKVERATV